MDFNDQLNRMKDLMTYGKVNEGTVKPTSTHTLEYKAKAADGKTYGIIRECSKFYIKRAETGKENLAEAYQYIGGFNNKKNYEYDSYASALKNLEFKLSSINEAQQGYDSINVENQSSYNVNNQEMDTLTESMRSEIARQRQLMHNTAMLFNESCQIGKTPFTSQPEAEHANSGDKNAPYTDAAKAEPEFGGSKENSPKEAGTPYGNGNAKKKAQKGKDIKVDGSVASQKPSGAKAVKMNESVEDISDDDIDNVDDIEKDIDVMDDEPIEEPAEDSNFDDDDTIDMDGGDDEDIVSHDDSDDDFSVEDSDDDSDEEDDEENSDDEEDDSDDEEDGDSEDNEFTAIGSDDEEPSDEDSEDEEGDEEDMDDTISKHSHKKGKEILLSDNDSEDDDEEYSDEDEIEECGMPEFENLSESKKRLMNKLANMIVNEVMSNFGSHPGFRKQPMTMPAGGENKPFATSKGDSKPYSSCYKSGDANICKNKDIVDDKMRKKIMKCLKTDEVRDKFASKICEAVMKNLKKHK